MKNKITQTLQSYISPFATVQQTSGIVAVTSGMVVKGGRIERYWENQDVDYRRFFKKYPQNLFEPEFNDVASFVEYFKLHSVEFGNWLNQEERRQFLAAAADSLIQLSKHLKVSPSSMGLNRKLSIALGARGTGGKRVAAHYERNPYSIINITKPHADYGSFAHEYGHALDNLVSGYVTKGKMTMISLDYQTPGIKSNKYTDLMSKIFKALLGTDEKPTPFKTRLEDMTDYFKFHPEIFARSFESNILYQDGKSYNRMFIKDNYDDKIYPDNAQLKNCSEDIIKFGKMAIQELNGLPLDMPKENININIPEPEPKPEPVPEPKKEQPKVAKREPKPEIPKVEVKPGIKISKPSKPFYGDTVEIVTPTQKLPAKFAVVDIHFLIQSNDPFTFSPNPDYPETCQTRDYKTVKGEQNKVIEYAAQFEPKHLINSSPDATTGTPVSTRDGVILGGNGRTMILKRVFANFKDKYENYVQTLKKVSSVLFGIDESEIEKFENPVIVRILDNAPIAECSKYSNILNQSNAQVYDEFQEGISIAKEIINNPYAYKNIALAIAEQDAETIAEMFADKKLNAMIIDTLKSIKFINNANMDLYVDQKDYMITDRGRAILVNALLSSILPDKQLLTQADKYKNKILATLPAWIQINSLKNEFNIIPNLQKALRIEAQRKSSKMPLKDFIVQISAFSEETDVITIEILKILEYSKLKDFRNFAKYYAERALESDSDNVFGEKSEPRDIIFTWLNGNKEINLSGAIAWDYHTAVKNHAQFLFEDTPVSVSIIPTQVNIYRKTDQKLVGQIDLELMKVVSNQFDMFDESDLAPYANRIDALLSYIKGLKPKRIVRQEQPALFDRIPEGVRLNDNIITEDLPASENQINLENNQIIPDVNENIYPKNNFDEPEEETEDTATSLDEVEKIPTKPLYIHGKTRQLLTRLNQPFQMLIWGMKGGGKSSLSLKIADELTVNGNVLYVLTEEYKADGRIGERSKRMNIQNSTKIKVIEAQTIAKIIEEIETGLYKFVVIDSKDAFEDEKLLLPMYQKYRKHGISFITVSHSVKNDKFSTGDRMYGYLNNTEIHVSKQGSIATVVKHRDAPDGNSVPVFANIRPKKVSFF